MSSLEKNRAEPWAQRDAEGWAQPSENRATIKPISNNPEGLLMVPRRADRGAAFGGQFGGRNQEASRASAFATELTTSSTRLRTSAWFVRPDTISENATG